jgi:hypothetical protein
MLMYPNTNQFTINSLLLKINSIKLNSFKLNFFYRRTKHIHSISKVQSVQHYLDEYSLIDRNIVCNMQGSKFE